MANFEDKKGVRCSFCGKSQDSVNRIIAGPGVYICNECVELCSSIVEDDYEGEDVEADGSVVGSSALQNEDIELNVDFE